MVRMDADLRIRLPASMVAALERAARRQMLNVSTYARQALHARLVGDGVLTIEGEEVDSSRQERMSA